MGAHIYIGFECTRLKISDIEWSEKKTYYRGTLAIQTIKNDNHRVEK